jgi:hypothetical protein
LEDAQFSEQELTMDQTHFLASQSLQCAQDYAPARKDEIDAFYEEHGRAVFALGYRVRRWVGALAARVSTSAKAKVGFAPMASNR